MSNLNLSTLESLPVEIFQKITDDLIDDLPLSSLLALRLASKTCKSICERRFALSVGGHLKNIVVYNTDDGLQLLLSILRMPSGRCLIETITIISTRQIRWPQQGLKSPAKLLNFEKSNTAKELWAKIFELLKHSKSLRSVKMGDHRSDVEQPCQCGTQSLYHVQHAGNQTARPDSWETLAQRYVHTVSLTNLDGVSGLTEWDWDLLVNARSLDLEGGIAANGFSFLKRLKAAGIHMHGFQLSVWIEAMPQLMSIEFEDDYLCTGSWTSILEVLRDHHRIGRVELAQLKQAEKPQHNADRTVDTIPPNHGDDVIIWNHLEDEAGGSEDDQVDGEEEQADPPEIAEEDDVVRGYLTELIQNGVTYLHTRELTDGYGWVETEFGFTPFFPVRCSSPSMLFYTCARYICVRKFLVVEIRIPSTKPV
ncbi:hypothetical protein M011DRAFT_461988 [Sporormia fimetaria CBS 119925]|uniref:F-box domain-containing protein n=1 Tax=Sporormia fimetaria CBS 119925 TaxID=1340428 RepID=A0A6A6V128_9PLEO|nr:hypothetical protein M011DRAFT_461988 [Sporormia fimetaria CBS 119925]